MHIIDAEKATKSAVLTPFRIRFLKEKTPVAAGAGTPAVTGVWMLRGAIKVWGGGWLHSPRPLTQNSWRTLAAGPAYNEVLYRLAGDGGQVDGAQGAPYMAELNGKN